MQSDAEPRGLGEAKDQHKSLRTLGSRMQPYLKQASTTLGHPSYRSQGIPFVA